MKTQLQALTITLNPAIDETIFLDHLTPGTVHRAREYHRQAGGKGINVASMMASAGLEVMATGFLGRDNPAIFERLFRARGVDDRFVRLPGETRTGIKIVDRETRETTDVNLPGLKPSPADWQELESVLRASVRPGLWVVVSGSLPPGVDPGAFGALISSIKALGGHVAVDTSGPPLEAAVAAGVDLIKPNRAELSELTGRDLSRFGDVLSTAVELHRGGIAHVIVSLGEEGALVLAPEQGLMAGAPLVSVVSTVGAGDALLAGYLAGLVEGRSPAERAREATVFAWCALESLNRTLVSRAEREARAAQISVHPLPD